MKRALVGLLGTLLAVVAACSDDAPTEPAQVGTITTTPPDAGTDAAVATLPSSGVLVATTSEKLAVAAQRKVALHASVKGGAGPYHLAWSQSSGPVVELVGTATLDPTFTAPFVATSTDLGFSLLVVDATGSIVGAKTTVTIAPNGLFAATAPALRTGDGQTVTLNAVVSGSLEGATFFWRQVAGTAVTITAPSTAAAAVTFPTLTAAATYGFELVAANRDGTTTEAVTVDVVPASVLATPFPDGGTATFAASAGAPSLFATPASLVALNASTTNPRAAASYTWAQIGGTPVVALSSAVVANPTFTAPVVATDTELVFRLTATDGTSTATSDVTVTVNASAPFAANAGGDQAAAAGATTYLGGAAVGGSGPYRWLWTQKGGSPATLAGAETANPRVTLPQVAADETITFTLAATDGAGKQVTDDVAVAVRAPTQNSTGFGSRPLSDSERSVYACSGLDCFTEGTEVVCDERTPFALTTLTGNGAGRLAITKSCVSSTTCLTSWIKDTKTIDLCTSVLPPLSAGAEALQNSDAPVTCSYCCFGAACNRGLVPASATIPTCPGDVCYPLRDGP